MVAVRGKGRRCDHWCRGGYPCRYPAKFKVRGNPGRDGREQISVAGEAPCGLHVRPYLMDNGDSVRAPWIVERLEAA